MRARSTSRPVATRPARARRASRRRRRRVLEHDAGQQRARSHSARHLKGKISGHRTWQRARQRARTPPSCAARTRRRRRSGRTPGAPPATPAPRTSRTRAPPARETPSSARSIRSCSPRCSRAREPFVDRQRQQQREVGHEPAASRHVRDAQSCSGDPAAHALIRVRRQKEPVDEHDVAALERRPDLALHQLRARRHEQQRLGARHDVRRRVEQDAPDLVADERAARLAHGHARRGRCVAEPLGEAPELRASCPRLPAPRARRAGRCAMRRLSRA